MAPRDTGLPLESERLILRHVEPRDIEVFMAYAGDPSVQAFQGWPEMSEHRARRFIEGQKDAVLGEPGEWVQIALEWKELGAMVGDLGFRVNADLPHEAELGYRVAGAYQRRGFAREGAARLLDHAFSVLRLHRIIAYTACENHPSIGVLERLGFRREGHFRKSYKVHGEWIDEYLYALLEEEWRR
jgi:RimJ/RimL family protein N-acetyltransferase